MFIFESLFCRDRHVIRPCKEYVTVVFHAMLSPKFITKKDMRVYIVGGEPLFKGWECESVSITLTK